MNLIVEKLKTLYFQITNKEYEFKLDEKLVDDLGMSSVVFVYLMLLIEEEFNIDVYHTVYDQFKTVSDLVNFIIKEQEKNQL